MRVAVELLVLACLVVGAAPALAVGRMLAAASRPVVGGTLPDYDLAVWHRFRTPLLMSVVALFGGALAYLVLKRRPSAARLGHALATSADAGRAFWNGLAASRRAGRWACVRLLEAGLTRQLLLVLVVAVALALAAWGLRDGVHPGSRPTLALAPSFALLWILGAAAAVGEAWRARRDRLGALMLTGVAGVAVVITFSWYSAPDLALTQLAVEVVTTLLVLLGLRWLPRRDRGRTGADAPGRRARDLGVAIAVGGGMATLAYAVATRDLPEGPSAFFLERALTDGGGRNVVNVILVDFRGFDTFGEGVVLSIVALTVYALLRRFRPARETMRLPHQQRAVPADLATDLLNPRRVRDPAVGYLMVPAVLARLLLPLVIVVAFHLFLRGHNAPGGGFVGGLVTSAGLLLQYLVSGAEWVEERVRLAPRALIATGLLLAIATGAGAIVAGHPLLTSRTWHFEVPIVGEVHLPSATFFDLGVFSLVVGSTLFMLVAIAHQSVRAARRRTPDGARARARDRDRRPRRVRSVARAPAADVPAADRPHADLVRGEPLYLQHGEPCDRQGADPRGQDRAHPRELRGSHAAGARPHRDRHQLRDYRAAPGRHPRVPRLDGEGPRGRRGVTALLHRCMPHLVVAPILLPMATAAVMLLMGEGRRPWKVVLGTGSMLAGLATAVALLWWTSARGPVTYVPGGWPAAAGIAVVADRLSALMLVLAWILGPSAVVFSAARWHRAAVHFHPLLQLQLMGLSGAFLAGDLFNLFVFFEILLAASYGLLLHGSGRTRIVAGLRYVAVNLTASSLFLVGAAMLYGVTGTLNLAALAEHLAAVGPEDRGLLEAGAGILAVAFLAKAAAWPATACARTSRSRARSSDGARSGPASSGSLSTRATPTRSRCSPRS
jgi:monovalent cation:proton antiporter